MELLFDHTLGKQEQQDLVICRPMAIVEHDEEEEALDGGWLALDHPVADREVFYQSRSTRINLDLYRPCLLYTSPSPRDLSTSRMPSSA